MNVNLMDLAARLIVRVVIALPPPIRNRLMVAALYRGKPPPWR
jgi:hypothetical protein